MSSRQKKPTSEECTKEWEGMKPKFWLILEIFDKNKKHAERQSISPETYMRLLYEYRTLYERICGFSEIAVQLYIELYNLWKDYVAGLDGMLIRIKHLEGELLLRAYLESYSNFCSGADMVAKLVRPLDRFWIPTRLGKVENGLTIQELPRLYHAIWQKYAYDDLKNKLRETTFSLVRQHRQGEQVDTSLVAQMIKTFFTLSPDDVALYEKDFEESFLWHTRQYYLAESSSVLHDRGINYFLEHFSRRIEEEEHWGQGKFFHPRSLTKVQDVLTETIVYQHIDSLQSIMVPLLEQNQSVSLKQFFSLFSRKQGGIQLLATHFQECIHKIKGGQIFDPQLQLDPQEAMKASGTFVDVVVQLHKQLSQQVKDCFQGNPLCHQALNTGLTILMNKPAKARGSALTRIFAYHIHTIMSKGSGRKDKTPQEIEEDLDSLAFLVCSFEDSLEFFEHHRKHFMRRLLSPERKFSVDLEEFLLTKLKEYKGEQFTRKLSSMLNDAIGDKVNNLHSAFDQHCEGKGSEKKPKIKFEGLILNDGSWPLAKHDKFPLPGQPNEFIEATGSFEEFFSTREQAKKLRWLYGLGKVNVTMNIQWPYGTNGRPSDKGASSFTAIVSPLQASILALFNSSSEWTTETLLGALWPDSSKGGTLYIGGGSDAPVEMNLSQQLLSALEPLCNRDGKTPFKLISKKGEETETKSSEITTKDILVRVQKVVVSKESKGSPKREIVFPFQSVKNVISSGNAVDRYVEQERSSLIECAVVKLMKTKVKMRWEQLYAATVEDLKSRFTPAKSKVKQRVESLIDRDFIARDQNDSNVFHYVS